MDMGMAFLKIRPIYLDYAYFFCILPFGTLVPAKDHQDEMWIKHKLRRSSQLLENGFEQTLFPLGLNTVSYQENKNYKQIPLHHHLVISFVMFYKIMPGFHEVGHL